jgi:integrase
MKSRGHNLAGATLNRFKMALSAVLSWAIKKGWTPEDYGNPCQRIPNSKEGKPRERILTPEEQKKLLYAAEGCRWPIMWAIIRIGLTTGARRGEISGMTWDNVDLDKGLAVFPLTKNGESRTIPLLPDVCEYLRPWKKKTGYVFASDKKANKPMLFEAIWQDCLADAGLKGSGVVFHSLRHTCITSLVASKANIIQIQKLVGHSSPQMVARYTHQTDEDKAELVSGVFANGA